MRKILLLTSIAMILFPGVALAAFVDNGDGTVTDTATGLMWHKETAYSRDWRSALHYCEDLSRAGYSDWRLPTIKELASIVDLSRCYPAIDTNYFPYTESSDYWSSTTDAFYTSDAWVVYFSSGWESRNRKYHTYNYVRAVRSGQSVSLDNFVISDISSPQSIKVPFEVTITARNESGGLVTGFNGNVILSSSVPLSPTMIKFSNGTWTGNVILYEGGSNISLVVSGLGISGTSNLFSTEPLKGDLDADGDVDVTDAVLGLQILAGVASKNVKITADLSSDGKIGMEEVIYILQKVSGLRQ